MSRGLGLSANGLSVGQEPLPLCCRVRLSPSGELGKVPSRGKVRRTPLCLRRAEVLARLGLRARRKETSRPRTRSGRPEYAHDTEAPGLLGDIILVPSQYLIKIYI